MIQATCPGCGCTLEVDDAYARLTGPCLLCGHLVAFEEQPTQHRDGPATSIRKLIDLSDGSSWHSVLALVGALLLLYVLIVATLLPWTATGIGLASGDVRFALCVHLALLTLYLASMLNGRLLPTTGVCCAGWGGLLFLWTLTFLGWSAGAGVYTTLLASLGLLGCGVLIGIRHPWLLEQLLSGADEQLRKYGVLLLTLVGAALLGICAAILHLATMRW